MTQDVVGSHPTVTCDVCERTVPAGEFCGACGAHLVANSPHPARRHHAFAANPHEHVLQLSLISTLFPHLPHRRTAPFRLALGIVVIGLLVLGYFRLTGPSIAASALAVPLLYLLYLYEVEVYEDDPVYVLGVTIALGAVLGFFWAHLTGDYVTRTVLLQASPQGIPAGRLLLVAGVIPIVAQLLMLAGVGVLYFTRKYDEALDGFVFGVACAMGFVLATTLVNLWPELQSGLTAVGSEQTNMLRTGRHGLLIPFINASTTGLIGGALWLRRGRVRAMPAYGWTTTVSTAVLVALVIQVALRLVDIYVSSQLRATAIYALIAIILLLAVRVAMHHLLLAEAVESTVGPEAPCSHCRRVVPRMGFCPHCGVATRATPKTGAGLLGRAVR